MKKLILCLTTVFLLLFLSPVQSKAANDPDKDSKATTEKVKSAEADILIARLEEIKAMDMSVMSFGEKRVLRKEVRTIKSDLKEIENDGVFISVGAIIIIILLLILLL